MTHTHSPARRLAWRIRESVNQRLHPEPSSPMPRRRSSLCVPRGLLPAHPSRPPQTACCLLCFQPPDAPPRWHCRRLSTQSSTHLFFTPSLWRRPIRVLSLCAEEAEEGGQCYPGQQGEVASEPGAPAPARTLSLPGRHSGSLGLSRHSRQGCGAGGGGLSLQHHGRF